VHLREPDVRSGGHSLGLQALTARDIKMKTKIELYEKAIVRWKSTTFG
jgi:hypothetical protein